MVFQRALLLFLEDCVEENIYHCLHSCVLYICVHNKSIYLFFSPVKSIVSSVLKILVGKLWPMKIQNNMFYFVWFEPNIELFILLNYIKMFFSQLFVLKLPVLLMTQSLTRNVSQCSINFKDILWRIEFPIMCLNLFLIK